MKHPDEDMLLQIEALLNKRLDLLKQYPSLSVEAMQLLENRNISGFDIKLEQRSELASQVDTVSNHIASLISLLSHGSSIVVAGIVSSGDQTTDCPPWTSGIARSMERTRKLLRNCALFDAKLMSHAHAVHADIQAQLAGVHAQKKIQNGYADHHAVSSGMHIHISTK